MLFILHFREAAKAMDLRVLQYGGAVQFPSHKASKETYWREAV